MNIKNLYLLLFISFPALGMHEKKHNITAKHPGKIEKILMENDQFNLYSFCTLCGELTLNRTNRLDTPHAYSCPEHPIARKSNEAIEVLFPPAPPKVAKRPSKK